MEDNSISKSAILVDAREAARRLGISVRTMWSLAKRGEIPRVSVTSRCIRFRACDLERFVEEKIVNDGVATNGS